VANRRNHRRGEARRTETGPRHENPNPGAGCNSTHVARSRAKWKRRRARAERRTDGQSTGKAPGPSKRHVAAQEGDRGE
jgi:hypothetical protein